MAQDMIKQDRPAAEAEIVEMERAIAQYRLIQQHLEADAPNAYVTIDADTGNYVVATSRRAASAAFRETYGAERPGWTMHIGTT